MSTTVRVRHVTHATPRTRIITLDFSDSAFQFAAGQAIMIGLHESPLRKPYSIASAPWELRKTGMLQVLAQVDDTGSPDPHLELAAPGTLIDVDGPFGSFALPLEFDAVPVLFIAGGTGIAPLRSMLMDRLARPRAGGVSVIFSARTAEEFAYRAELEAMASAGRITLWLTVTRPDAAWNGRKGRIDDALVRDALVSTDACCLVCGPPALVSSVTELLVRGGVARDRVLIENY